MWLCVFDILTVVSHYNLDTQEYIQYIIVSLGISQSFCKHEKP